MWFKTNLISITSLTIVSMQWILTFLVFVPIHKKIDNSNATLSDLENLVSKNRIRTVLWTVLFLLSVINFIYYP